MNAIIFINKKQDEWFKIHGVYADTNQKIAEWMEEYHQQKVKESNEDSSHLINMMYEDTKGDSLDDIVNKGLLQTVSEISEDMIEAELNRINAKEPISHSFTLGFERCALWLKQKLTK